MVGGTEKFANVLVPFVTIRRKRAAKLVLFMTSQRVDFQQQEKEIRSELVSSSYSVLNTH